jgi:hypothetical protein
MVMGVSGNMSNEVILIDQFLAAAQSAREKPLPDSVAFELFAAECVLRDKTLSADELEAGRIGGGKDGGIDGLYVFQDGSLLDEDSPIFAEGFKPSSVRKNVDIEVWVIQAKREDSFTETAIDKISSSLGRFLDLAQTDAQLTELYSKEAVARVRVFTNAWKALGIRSPRITMRVEYVTKGDIANVASQVNRKLTDLENLIQAKIHGATSIARLTGAKELWSISSTEPEYDLQLRVAHYVPMGEAYSGLIHLADYFDFLSDENGQLRTNLFDWNVRDYQGEKVTVNRGIQATLESDSESDFWWFNNGVTILCSSISIGADNTFTLTGVQIVNGMQTSHEIHTSIARIGVELERARKRSVSVRIIQTQDEEVRDKIIRATNSQTKVHDASLHATEGIHRQIEAHFKSHGWYYDRRKNFYKNTGKSADRIVGISALGQAVMAIGLSRPNDARARPSTLLNDASDYRAVFNEQTPLEVYLWLASTQKRIDADLLVESDAYERSNLRFYVSCYIITKKYGNRVFSPQQLRNLAAVPLDMDRGEVWMALEHLRALVDQFTDGDEEWSYDRVAKSKLFAEQVISAALDDDDDVSGYGPESYFSRAMQKED